MKIKMDYKLAMAIMLDAMNRNKKKHGRTACNKQDWNAGVKAFDKAMNLIKS